MNIVGAMIQENPEIKIAVIDKDEPGGICLTRGCIPSKIMLYPAELVRTLDEAEELGVDVEVKRVSYERIMKRMRALIDRDIDSIRDGLSGSQNIDYYHETAEFVAPYKLAVGGRVIGGKLFFLATGSRPVIPHIAGLDSTPYYTSDSIIRMEMKKLPASMVIIGGGYIAAEFGHFFSALGSNVTILGRNAQFLPEEEPEVSALAKKVMGRHMTIVTGHEVSKVAGKAGALKRVTAMDRSSGKTQVFEAEEIIVATGRGPVNDILHPERGGVRTTKDGWIEVNDYLETSQPNVWALGDADGKYLFRHVANYESEIVYYNAVLKRKVKVDYRAIPRAVFAYPEVASVGMREKEAVHTHGKENVLIGFYRYEDTAKGEAMAVHDYFVKVIVDSRTQEILGAHIVGPHASVLIHEIIVAMYAPTRSSRIVDQAIHIHPALSEVVQRAFGGLMGVDEYHHHVMGEEVHGRRHG